MFTLLVVSVLLQPPPQPTQLPYPPKESKQPEVKTTTNGNTTVESYSDSCGRTITKTTTMVPVTKVTVTVPVTYVVQDACESSYSEGDDSGGGCGRRRHARRAARRAIRRGTLNDYGYGYSPSQGFYGPVVTPY